MKISETLIDFAVRHASDDVNALRLKYSGKKTEGDEDFDLEFALIQIEARKKARKKIPGFLANSGFVFPSLVASEQATNETVARFHASLVSFGTSLLDLTAGLGIDDLTFAKAGIKVTSCEIEKEKCYILAHNSRVFGLDNLLKVICTDSIYYLNNNRDRYDVIYADPARRDTSGKRVHALSDCMPDILGNMSLIMNHTDRLLVKSSPLLDLSLIINTVDNLHHVYVVCFRGECKEVLIDIRKNEIFTGVTAIDLDSDRIISEFHCKMLSIEDTVMISYAEHPSPSDYKYLYEPNAGVMKTGDWNTLQNKYPDLRKADVNTNIFFSDTLYNDFPGRILSLGTLPDKKALKRLKGSRYNIVARNHPLSAPLISQKYGIIAGGNDYLYAFRYKGKPVMTLATLIPVND